MSRRAPLIASLQSSLSCSAHFMSGPSKLSNLTLAINYRRQGSLRSPAEDQNQGLEARFCYTSRPFAKGLALLLSNLLARTQLPQSHSLHEVKHHKLKIGLLARDAAIKVADAPRIIAMIIYRM